MESLLAVGKGARCFLGFGLDRIRGEFQARLLHVVKFVYKGLEAFLRGRGRCGLWKGIKITDKDIRETRQELTEKLEKKW